MHLIKRLQCQYQTYLSTIQNKIQLRMALVKNNDV